MSFGSFQAFLCHVAIVVEVDKAEKTQAFAPTVRARRKIIAVRWFQDIQEEDENLFS